MDVLSEHLRGEHVVVNNNIRIKLLTIQGTLNYTLDAGVSLW